LIANAAQLAELLSKIEQTDRAAIDTEADSLHCYREKLCLLQISVRWIGFSENARAARTDAKFNAPRDGEAPGLTSRSENAIHQDYVIDPLAGLDLGPLCAALVDKEIVLHGADFDLRLLRRSLNFVPQRIFDTVIAARLIGIREFSLVALVERYFGIALSKGSQKANWAQRPLPARMEQYAINDTHYLLPLADRLGEELDRRDRLEWFRQSCQRALEQSTVSRPRDVDEAWRISGAGALRGRVAAVLRELWRWREKEAETADRPPFHILQNRELLNAAEGFVAGGSPDYKHFSARRRRAFLEAADHALNLPENEWPILRRRSGTRPTAEVVRRIEDLRRRRDHAAKDLDLEPSFIAPRATLEAIAKDKSRASELLVSWQRQLLATEL
jgi:ribonuclease D